MKNWAEMTKGEKSLRVGCTVGFAVHMAECAQEEDVAGAAICGLSAVAAMGLEPAEIRVILKLLETKANQDV